MSSIQQVDRQYPNLFNGGDDEGDASQRSESIYAVFNKYFGWTYTAERVAEFERITLEQAYELPLVQFLNDMAYLKMRGKMEQQMMKDVK